LTFGLEPEKLRENISMLLGQGKAVATVETSVGGLEELDTSKSSKHRKVDRRNKQYSMRSVKDVFACEDKWEKIQGLRDSKRKDVEHSKEEKYYTVNSSSDYTIKVEKNPLQDLFTLDSNRTKREEHKLQKLLHERSMCRDKYLGEESNPSSPKKMMAASPKQQLVISEQEKMPFSLAILAKIRQTLVKEIKTINKDPVALEPRRRNNNPSHRISELRNRMVPEEEAKFINNLQQEEKKKKDNDLRNRGSSSNAYYQIIALSKASRNRLKHRLEEVLPQNSRFLDF